jgi:hypothetical protein
LASTIASAPPTIQNNTRDTARRRVRHRDAALLHGRIGFTTWLGWRDDEAEDEGAPGLLTRRLSAAKPSRHARCGADANLGGSAYSTLSTASGVSIASAVSSCALRKSASARSRESVPGLSPYDDRKWARAAATLVPPAGSTPVRRAQGTAPVSAPAPADESSRTPEGSGPRCTRR